MAINASKINHRGADRIRIDMPYNPEISNILKQIPDAKWSRTMKAWHIACNAEACELLKKSLPETELTGSELQSFKLQGNESSPFAPIETITTTPPSKKQSSTSTKNVRYDNGPEFIAADFQNWCKGNEINILFTQPGCPTQNSSIERFNGSYAEQFWMPIFSGT